MPNLHTTAMEKHLPVICNETSSQMTKIIPESYALSIAPMMDCTDRHCRYLHRLITRHALLYTEMVNAQALIYGNTKHLLAHHTSEHPVALQIGGSDPVLLKKASQLGAQAGYSEINLNAGCPSSRVQEGCFGAILMRMPKRVSECLEAMMDGANGTEVTIKCRIGVDESIPMQVLPEFIEMVRVCGVKRLTIHARKALLKGLSPKKNRIIPPLDYSIVHKMKRLFPDMNICINGGISSLNEALDHLTQGLDGAMIGRSAYKHPFATLGSVDFEIFKDDGERNILDIMDSMMLYMENEIRMGTPLHHITRHLLGIFAGKRGARAWRVALSDRKSLDWHGISHVKKAVKDIHRHEFVSMEY